MNNKNIETYFNELAKDWSSRYKNSTFFRQRYNEFNELLTIYSDVNVVALDYGCGSGVLTELLAKKAGTVIGTDISIKMQQVASNELSEHSNITISEIEAIEENYYDLVICSSVIEYAEKDTDLLIKLSTYLKSNGILIITFPNRYGIFQLYNKYILSKIKANSYIDFQKNIYIKSTIKSKLKVAGFNLEKLHTHVGFPHLSKIGFGELFFCVARKK